MEVFYIQPAGATGAFDVFVTPTGTSAADAKALVGLPSSTTVAKITDNLPVRGGKYKYDPSKTGAARWIFDATTNYLPIPGSMVVDTAGVVFYLDDTWAHPSQFASFIIAEKAFQIKPDSNIDVVYEGIIIPTGTSGNYEFNTGQYVFHYNKGTSPGSKTNSLRVQYLSERVDLLSDQVDKVKADILDLSSKKFTPTDLTATYTRQPKDTPDANSARKGGQTMTLNSGLDVANYDWLQLHFIDKNNAEFIKTIQTEKIWKNGAEVGNAKGGYSDWYDESKYPNDVIHRGENKAAHFRITAANTFSVIKTAGAGLFLSKVVGFTSTASLTSIPVDDVTIEKDTADNDKLQVKDGGIDTAQIANNAVVGTKIANGAVGNTKLANNSVRLNHIRDNNVTTSKIQNDAVTTAKIDDDAITTAKIDDEAVTKAKLSSAVQGVLDTGTMTFTRNGIKTSYTAASDSALVMSLGNVNLDVYKVLGVAIGDSASSLRKLGVISNLDSNNTNYPLVEIFSNSTSFWSGRSIYLRRISSTSVVAISNLAITGNRFISITPLFSISEGGILDGAISSSKLQDSSVTSSKLAQTAFVASSTSSEFKSKLGVHNVRDRTITIPFNLDLLGKLTLAIGDSYTVPQITKEFTRPSAGWGSSYINGTGGSSTGNWGSQMAIKRVTSTTVQVKVWTNIGDVDRYYKATYDKGLLDGTTIEAASTGIVSVKSSPYDVIFSGSATGGNSNDLTSGMKFSDYNRLIFYGVESNVQCSTTIETSDFNDQSTGYLVLRGRGSNEITIQWRDDDTFGLSGRTGLAVNKIVGIR